MYHAVTTDPALPSKNSLYVTAETLEKQLADIVEYGYTAIFAGELGEPLPEKPIIITFDDGYRDNYTLAFPLLQKYNLRATIFLIASAPSYGLSGFVTWDQAREMVKSGLVEFQSHTFDQHGAGLSRLPGESAAEHETRLQMDWDAAAAVFARELGTVPTVLCYPSGQYDSAVLRLVPQWYSYAVTTKSGIGRPEDSPFEMYRYRITEKSTISKNYIK